MCLIYNGQTDICELTGHTVLPGLVVSRPAPLARIVRLRRLGALLVAAVSIAPLAVPAHQLAPLAITAPHLHSSCRVPRAAIVRLALPRSLHVAPDTIAQIPRRKPLVPRGLTAPQRASQQIHAHHAPLARIVWLRLLGR